MRLQAKAAGAIVVLGSFLTGAAASGQCANPTTGPDVIVGDIIDSTAYGNVSPGHIYAFDLGTTSCNLGNVDVQWVSGTNMHPVIGQNLYRLKNGRFEQIGMSWLKHAFTALTENICCTCNGHGGAVLGQGCSDPYCCGLNGGQSRLGERSTVNAASGVYTYPYTIGWQATGDNVYKRLQVNDADLIASQNVGALYFGECQYVTQDDATAHNNSNNASYRPITVASAPPYTLTPTGSTQRTHCAIEAWRANDPAVTLIPIDIPNDGRIWLAYKVTSVSAGVWHYEYAIENLTSDRSVGSVSIPVLGAVISNIGYHDVKYHSGEPYSTADWTATQSGGNVTWACVPYAQNQNANALRWGTLRNVRFDATTAPLPQTANMTIGLFKPGTPTSVTAAIAVPGPADCNTNGTLDTIDIANGASRDCNSNLIPDECELATNDCNSNGTPDNCEGTDCDTNGIRDFCELIGRDCNTDSILDVCQMAGHDCNTNNIYDACDAVGHDCNTNHVPDVCEPDCDRNGTIDACAGEPDCNTNGVPDSCDVSSHPGNLDYASGPINLPIPDHSTTGVSSSLTATMNGPVQDVNVTVHIQHPDVSQLLIALIHGPTSVTLWNSRCSGAANLNITFDDQGVTPVNCSALNNAIYRPSAAGGGSLASFNGQSSQGAWTLKVIDLTTGGVGTLTSWTINIVIPNFPPTSADVNTNGIPDECECTCRGDMNHDGVVDGRDIQGFVTDYLAGTYFMCADIDHSGTMTEADVNLFAGALIANSCP